MFEAVAPGVTRHIAATAAAVHMPDSRLDMVRLGGLLLNLTPVGKSPWGLQTPLSFTAPVVQVKKVPPGWNIGYRLMFSAPDWMTVGVVAVGAGDSYPYALKFRADVLVRGQRCRVIGMGLDQSIIDLTNVPAAEDGDEALLIGVCEDGTLSAEDLADAAGTSYGELLSRIPSRIPRLYFENGLVTQIDSPTEMTELLTC
jgi:alanine racemase